MSCWSSPVPCPGESRCLGMAAAAGPRIPPWMPSTSPLSETARRRPQARLAPAPAAAGGAFVRNAPHPPHRRVALAGLTGIGRPPTMPRNQPGLLA